MHSKNIPIAMECIIRTISTDSAEVVAHFLVYPNGSVFVWVFGADDPSINDFHTAVPSKFSSVPSVSTKIGELESTGRALALKLTTKFQVPMVVSWNIDNHSPAVISAVETSLFHEIKNIQSNRVSRSPVVGA